MPFPDFGWVFLMHIDYYCKEFAEGYQGTRPNFCFLTEACSVCDPWAVRNAVHDIPNQSNSWSCGVVAAARALTIAGMAPRNYQDFHNYARGHALGHIECGPGPGNLYSMMGKGASYKDLPEGFGFGLDITEDRGPQEHLLNESLRLRRPMLVLFEVANRSLHWAVVVGHETAAQGRLLLLNSDGCIYLMHRDELWRRMDLRGHPVSHLPIVSDRIGRFNSISCTWGELPSDTAADHRRNFNNRNAQLRGDHSPVFNAVDTVLGCPIVGLTPIGWGWRALRGLGKEP